MAARAELRAILGRRLGVHPGAVRFTYGPHGKPELDSAHGSSLRFNLSHSGDWALIALGHGGPLGVDLEVVRPLPDLEQLSRTCFSPGERQRILTAPPVRREQRFFRCWTLKEAWLKARGTGLCEDLTQVETTESGPGQARVRRCGTGRPEPGRLFSWEPAPGLVAALALEGQR